MLYPNPIMHSPGCTDGSTKSDPLRVTKDRQSPDTSPSRFKRLRSFILDNYAGVEVFGRSPPETLEKMTDGKHVIVGLVGFCLSTQFDKALARQHVMEG